MRREPVAVISDVFWKRQFNGDEGVLGQQLTLGTQKVMIIGVAPPGFRGIELDATDVWLPMTPAVIALRYRVSVGAARSAAAAVMLVLLRYSR